jgi:magnesium-transporting ATPase (P-type)
MQGGYVECESPNEMLYKFEGSLAMGGERKDLIVPLSTEQILLRGSSLRNTEFVYGLVVFTGHETKIMKNSVGSRAKFSRLEKALNIYIFLIVMIQLIISLIGAILNTIW